MGIEEIISLVEAGDFCVVLAVLSTTSCGWMAHQWVKERERSAELTELVLKAAENTVRVIERVSTRG